MKENDEELNEKFSNEIEDIKMIVFTYYSFDAFYKFLMLFYLGGIVVSQIVHDLINSFNFKRIKK